MFRREFFGASSRCRERGMFGSLRCVRTLWEFTCRNAGAISPCFSASRRNPDLSMRKTKIICTLGPASQEPDVLAQMMRAGADVFRLNMSHAKHEWVREVVPRIREIADEVGRTVAILM